MFSINEEISYSPLFSYREYEVIKQNNFRYYKIQNRLVPSVTSILRLSRYNQRDTFSSKQADSLEIGNLMHSYLDKYVKREKIITQENNNSKIAMQLCKSMIENTFPIIDKFVASEATIHEDYNYAGRLDLLAEINGKLTVIDYKSSYRKKSSFQIDEHFQQLAAYASAHDKMFNTKIERAMIFIVYKDTYENDILEADLSLLNNYKEMWIDKLKYYNDVS